MGCSELSVFLQREDHRCPRKQAVIKYSAALIHFCQLVLPLRQVEEDI